MVRFKLGHRRIGNRALHSNTSMNSLHYSFQQCHDNKTRFLILLQAVGWITGFVGNEDRRNMLRELTITEMPAVEIPDSDEETVEAIFNVLPNRTFLKEITDRTGQDQACRMTFAMASKNPTPLLFMRTGTQADLSQVDRQRTRFQVSDCHDGKSTMDQRAMATSLTGCDRTFCFRFFKR